MTSSGKNEGIGGTEALTTKRIPKQRPIKCCLDSEANKIPNRDNTDCLRVPPEKNIPIDAHPWAKDKRAILIKATFLLDNSPITIKVMCVTILYAINFFTSDCIEVKMLASTVLSIHNPR